MNLAVVILALGAPNRGRVETAIERVDAALAGLQAYFFDASGSFWKACGQNGGNGEAPTHFDCTCETTSPFCKNCFRWWMSTTMQSLMSLNQALPGGHVSLNQTKQLIEAMRQHSPYTSRAAPSWAYIDDYLWYVSMWMHAFDWMGEQGDLQEAAATMELMAQWGMDYTCGGITWMYPDVDPRKNSITTLEAIQSSAQLAVGLAAAEPVRASSHKQRALDLWNFFTSVGLLGGNSLVHDNVTGTADGLFHCCNATIAPVCEPRNTIAWSYNQGMLLGAMVDMHALTGDAQFLKIGVDNLDSVIATMTRAEGSAKLVLDEPVGLTVQSDKCDADNDPSASAGGDLYSFKAVFMQQLPRFLAAASSHMQPAQKAAANRLVADSADAAWATRTLPPFPDADVCNEFRNPPAPSSGPPKFSWDWGPLPADGALTCMDGRTQSQALSLFVADLVMALSEPS